MAEPARQDIPQEAPEQEAPKPKGQFSPEGLSLGETEKQNAEKGHELLTGKKAEFDEDITKNTNLFKDTVSSWRDRIKKFFSRSKNAEADQEIGKLEEKAEALKQEYQQKAEAAVAEEPAPDNLIDLAAERAKREGPAPEPAAEEPAKPQAEIRPETLSREELLSREAELSARFDELAQVVKEEGEEESKAMKKALKTGVMPEASEAGRKLNATYAALNRVRGELSKVKPEAEAPKAGEMSLQEALDSLEAEEAAAPVAEAAAEPVAEPAVETPTTVGPQEIPVSDEDVIDMVDIGGGRFVPASEAERLPGKEQKALPPGEPEAAAKEPAAPAPEARATKAERPAAKGIIKNAYDAQALDTLKSHLAYRQGRLTKPGRFTDKTEKGKKELSDEKEMIARMKESVTRREKTETETPKAEPAPEAPPAPEPAEAEAAPEKEDDLSSMEFYEPHFGKIAETFLKDPKIDPAAVKMTLRKAKAINALDLGKLLESTGAFDADGGESAASGIAKELLENPALLKAAQVKFASEVEALLKKKKP